MNSVPNEYFNNDYYLAHHKDVARAGVDPLEHFSKFGLAEGRVHESDYDLTALHEQELASRGVSLRDFLEATLTEPEKQSLLHRYKKLKLEQLIEEIREFERQRPTQRHETPLIDELFPLCKQFRIHECQNTRPRLNIFLPTVAASKTFGGISTALDLFFSLAEQLKGLYDLRIVSVDDEVSDGDVLAFEGFEVAALGEDGAKIVVSGLNRDQARIGWRRNEVCIVTFWTTFYSLFDELKRLRRAEENTRIVYLVQDYEPNFYEVSARRVLCDETYSALTDGDFAVFNTSLLKSFFDHRNYRFKKSHVFEPVLNQRVKSHVKFGRTRRNHLLFYARSNPRNLLAVGLLAIDRFKQNYPDLAEGWEVFGLGGEVKEYQFSDGSYLNCKGKLSLEEYAEALSTAKVGLSLMMAPHPSYPPLEMAYSGLRVVTNDFETKQLAGIHENLLSVDTVTADKLADAIAMQVQAANTGVCKEGLAFAGSLSGYTVADSPFAEIAQSIASSLHAARAVGS